MRRRRHRKRLGLPEYVEVALVVVAIASAGLWWRNVDHEVWPNTVGNVLSCKIESLHYNATRYANLVDIRYEYSAGGRPYLGHWRGYWPIVGSPNALPRTRMNELKTKGFPLTVMYNPANPSRSRLHDTPAGLRPAFAITTLVAIALSFAFTAYVYPKWRRRKAF